MQQVRVLFVSDGPSTGGATAAAIGADPALDLIARAVGADEALRLIEAEKPRAVVLYANRPGGAARETLTAATRSRHMAFIVVEGHRPPTESFDSVRRRIKAAVGVGLGAREANPPQRRAVPPRPAGPAKLIAIGASTGGVEALVTVISEFPRTCAPTVIVQHMPPFFTTSFAARLHSVSQATVHEAWDGAPLERGTIYLAPGGETHLEVQWNSARRVRLLDTPPVNRHRPSVDVAFHSVARQLGNGAVGVLLTGMGRDGADGLLAMRQAGARTIAQDQDTSTVYGMPRAALENGAVDRGTPLERIARAIFNPEQQTSEAEAWR
jgi:two-component system chemotaxis response regulator CheB